MTNTTEIYRKKVAQPARLAAALSQTVEQLRSKREAGDGRALSSHGYLRRVLEGVPRAEQALTTLQPEPPDSAGGRRARATAVAPSATLGGLMALEDLKRRARGDDAGVVV